MLVGVLIGSLSYLDHGKFNLREKGVGKKLGVEGRVPIYHVPNRKAFLTFMKLSTALLRGFSSSSSCKEFYYYYLDKFVQKNTSKL